MIAGLNPAHQMRQTLLYNGNSMQAWTPKEKKENSAFVRFLPFGQNKKSAKIIICHGQRDVCIYINSSEKDCSIR